MVSAEKKRLPKLSTEVPIDVTNLETATGFRTRISNYTPMENRGMQ